MPTLSWNGVSGRPLMPASTSETVNGEPFAVPHGASVMTVHVPALVGGGTTVKIQSLANTEQVEVTQSWADVTAFDPTDGSFEAVDGLPEGTTVTIPVTITGSGMLRFVASTDQSSAPVAIPVFFGR